MDVLLSYTFKPKNCVRFIQNIVDEEIENTLMATVMAVICSTAFPIMGRRIRPTKVLLSLACTDEAMI